MSKLGWSYPAGAANDPYAPYNQPDDPNEVLYENIYEEMEKDVTGFDKLDANAQFNIVDIAVKFCGDSYAAGYKQGQSDEGLARDWQEMDKMEGRDAD